MTVLSESYSSLIVSRITNEQLRLVPQLSEYSSTRLLYTMVGLILPICCVHCRVVISLQGKWLISS